MSLTPEQIEIRRTRIGGSEIAAILEDPITGKGCHPYKSALDVYRAKVPHAEVIADVNTEEDDGTSEEMKWGTHVEPAICSYVAAAHALELQDVGSLVPANLEYVVATPDRAGRKRADNDSTIYVVEAKSVGPHAAKMWKGGDDDRSAPLGYAMQVVWEMGVMRLVYPEHDHADAGLLCAAIAGAPPRTFLIPWDQQIFDTLCERARAFMRECVEARCEPLGWHSDRHALDYLRERWAKSNGSVLVPSPEDRDLALAYARAHAKAKALEGEARVLRARLCERIGENDALGDLVTWRSGEAKSTTTCDWESVAREFAPLLQESDRAKATEIVQRHTRILNTPGIRRLLVKPTLKGLLEAEPVKAEPPALAIQGEPLVVDAPAVSRCGASYVDRFSRATCVCQREFAPGRNRCRYHLPKPSKESAHV